jgi:tetratricopeptide (TPR) repeat protein
VQYNEVGDKSTETVAQFFDRVATFVNRRRVDRLVLDLRMNGGGDNTLNAPVIRAIGRMPAIDRRGHFLAIIGRQTFSAAQNLVNALEKYTDVIFVGEPTGSPPNMYGDATPVRLPNSGVSVYVSTVWWQDLDARDHRRWTAPEIAAELTAEDFRENRDPALDAALTAGPQPRLADRMLDPLERGDTALARRRYDAYVADARHVYLDTERALAGLALRLARARRSGPAVWVLELNVAEHPGSGEAFEHLGEAYALAGRKDLAAASFERALALDPRNFEAERRLRALREPS